jgi:hypothetical protein
MLKLLKNLSPEEKKLLAIYGVTYYGVVSSMVIASLASANKHNSQIVREQQQILDLVKDYVRWEDPLLQVKIQEFETFQQITGGRSIFREKGPEDEK